MNDTDNQLPPPPAEIPLDGTETAMNASSGEDAGMFSPQPETPYECAVAAYLETNASDTLRDKIREAQKNGKGIAQCYEYITAQARKEAKESQSVMIADAVVYGWAVHYFEDEWRDELERDRKAAEERKASAERLKRESEERKAKAKKAEAEHVAAMSPAEREAHERAKAEKAATEAKRKAEAEAKAKAEREAKRKEKIEAAKRRNDQMEKWKNSQLSFQF
ncbi:MAG: hypothetical protein ACI4QT_02990 [Kiritimatiellia bacterium]